MKVSVLMPTYNRAQLVPGSHATTLLDRAIISVLEQGYPDMELLILNDGSTDATSLVLKQYAKFSQGPGKPVIKIWDEKINRMPPNNMNFLWEQATGDLICQMHDDDIMPEGSIEMRANEFKKNKSLQALYGGWTTQGIDESGRVNYYATEPNPARILTNEYINFTTLMYRRDLPFHFDGELRYYFDWLFKIRCLNECVSGAVPEPVMIHTVHEGQETAKCRRENLNAEQEKMMREKLSKLGYK